MHRAPMGGIAGAGGWHARRRGAPQVYCQRSVRTGTDARETAGWKRPPSMPGIDRADAHSVREVGPTCAEREVRWAAVASFWPNRSLSFFFYISFFSFLFFLFSFLIFRFWILNLNLVVILHMYQMYHFKSCNKSIYICLYIYSLYFVGYFCFFSLHLNF
jgi:hypothetical protein